MMEIRKWRYLAIAFAIMAGAYLLMMSFRFEPTQARPTSDAALKTRVDETSEYKSQIGPPGSLYEGCRIEWGTKVCGEKAVFGRSYTPPGAEPSSDIVKPRELEHDTCYATQAKFRRIRTRMSQSQVNNIMGCGGELVSEMKVDLYPHRTFVWASRDGTGRAVVVYYGHQVFATRQDGLP